MAGRGFIHDKLELKFLILYITARVIEPIPFDTVLDLTMCDPFGVPGRAAGGDSGDAGLSHDRQLLYYGAQHGT